MNAALIGPNLFARIAAGWQMERERRRQIRASVNKAEAVAEGVKKPGSGIIITITGVDAEVFEGVIDALEVVCIKKPFERSPQCYSCGCRIATDELLEFVARNEVGHGSPHLKLAIIEASA